MTEDSLTIYKLIVLQLLNRVDFTLTMAQVSDFLLGKEYTNFITLQQVLSELGDAGFIETKTVRNRTHLTITPEGISTLQFFKDRMGDSLRKDIENYLKENELKLRNETSISSDYFKSVNGEFSARLIARDKENILVELTLSVPTEEMAVEICENWEGKNEEIYQYLVTKLF